MKVKSIFHNIGGQIKNNDGQNPSCRGGDILTFSPYNGSS